MPGSPWKFENPVHFLGSLWAPCDDDTEYNFWNEDLQYEKEEFKFVLIEQLKYPVSANHTHIITGGGRFNLTFFIIEREVDELIEELLNPVSLFSTLCVV